MQSVPITNKVMGSNPSQALCDKIYQGLTAGLKVVLNTINHNKECRFINRIRLCVIHTIKPREYVMIFLLIL